MKACISALAIAVAMFAVAPAAAQDPTLGGIAIGEPLATIRAQIGDPLRVTEDDGLRFWRFFQAGHLMDVAENNNVAVGVTVLALRDSTYVDQTGVAFGMTADRVKALRGAPDRIENRSNGSVLLRYHSVVWRDHEGMPALWVYGFGPKGVDFIELTDPELAIAAGTGPPVALGDGSSFDDAVVVVQPSESLGVAWEYAYLAAHPCANDGRWRMQKQALTMHDGFPYDVLTAACSPGNATRDFFFDIRSYFGKSTSSMNVGPQYSAGAYGAHSLKPSAR